MKARPSNILVNHPAYAKIVESYNRKLVEDGKVNAKKFYETVVLKEIPGYHMQSWYQFLKRFRTEAGIMPAESGPGVPPSIQGAESALAKTLLTNNEATNRAVAAALNISEAALRDIIEHPETLSVEKRAELFLKVMKAQDSRVKAIGGMRADNRDQARFDRAMDSSAFA